MKTRTLDAVEQRVTGALLEKALATPEYYPLTLKALVAACNQKTNREPVTSYDEATVASALERLRADVLVWRSDGARVARWKTTVDRRLEIPQDGLPLVTLLLLRGPQTPGELRSRAGRMRNYSDLAEVETALRRMSRGPDPLVAELPRRPGQKEARWTHLLGGGEAAPEVESLPAAPEPPAGGLAARVERLEQEVAALRRQLGRLLERAPGGSG